MDYKTIANELLDLLASELEEKYDELYELGEVEDSVNYEDARDEWVDNYIVKYTHLTHEKLDKLLHGEE